MALAGLRVVEEEPVGRPFGANKQVGALVHQQRKIGLLLDVRRVVEIVVDDVLGDAQRQRRIGAGLDGEEQVGVDHRRVEVRRDAHDLGAVIACFPREMGIGDAGLRDVAAPQHDVLGVEPVGALAGFGLHAPRQRLTRRQVAIPVVEGAEDAAGVLRKPRAGGE